MQGKVVEEKGNERYEMLPHLFQANFFDFAALNPRATCKPRMEPDLNRTRKRPCSVVSCPMAFSVREYYCPTWPPSLKASAASAWPWSEARTPG
jgi:hypothetical protein